MKKENLIGMRFNSLMVETYDEQSHKWKCICTCGSTKYVRTSDLKRGHVKSCGCKFNGKSVKHTHGNRVYNIWFNMIRRCTMPSDKSFKNYGERGIRVCDEWLNDFMSFYNWAMNNGYRDDLTIDRINNNGNYEPSNCRWVTMKEQHRNYSQNKNYTIDNETKCLTEWCEIYNIKYTTVLRRLEHGLSIYDALTKPVDKSKIPHKYRKD